MDSYYLTVFSNPTLISTMKHITTRTTSAAKVTIGLLYGTPVYFTKISGNVICNTGILTGKDVVKMLLAGGEAVQVVSAVYKKASTP
jgi:hypothetical protein